MAEAGRHEDRADAMRKVIVFRNDLLPLSETFVRQQVSSLKRWEAVLVGKRRSVPGLDLSGLRTHCVKPFGLTFNRWTERFLTRAAWMMTPEIRHLSGLQPDLLHVHFGTDAVGAWPWLRRLRLPTVVTLHGYDMTIDPDWWRSGHAGDGFRDYPLRIAELAAEPGVFFIAVSQAIRQKAIATYGIPAQKIDVLYIGVDNRVFHPADVPAGRRGPTVLFVARMVEKKGADVLIRAMARVQQSVPGANAIFIGDGPLRDQHQRLAADLGVAASFLGARPSSEVREQLSRARVFCLPSVTALNGDAEGLGIAILEAQAAGVPVVTSALGGRDEAIENGVTGFSFQERDVGALTERLAQLLTDDELATRMGQQAVRNIARKFSLDDCTAKLEQHYDRLVARHARAGLQ